MAESSTTKTTEQLLNCISAHLSSRPECRGVGYHLVIMNGVMRFTPDVLVLPDRYHRKVSDKLNVSEHVLRAHFPNLYQGRDQFGNLLIDTTKIVPGHYNYEVSFNKRWRRWVRKI